MLNIDDIYVKDSWADIVDIEISPFIENKLLISSSCDSNDVKSLKHTTNDNYNTYNIGDIISKDIESIDVITLLEWQSYVASYLKKYIKQCSESEIHKLDYDLHITKFEWLAKVSKLLSNKSNLITTTHKVNNHNIQQGIIPRSSYKFCEYNYDCQYNYREKYNGCYAQHFVHNLVYADIISVIYYMNRIHETNKDYDYKELNKCITTISYVLKHMYDELFNLQYHYGDIYDKLKNKKQNNKIKIKNKC